MNYNPAIGQNSSPTSILLTPTSHALRLNASTKFMEWTNDDALELIEQYRSHTELWNRADPKYKDKLCRFRAWSEIAERFGCSKAEVERKMNVLLTQYRREKHKMLVKLYQGIQPNPSKWYAFKRFDFMEAGGGSSANLLAATSGMLPNSTNSPPVSIVGTNGHQHVSTAPTFNGLTPNYGDPSRLGTSNSGTSSQHRRIKSKELKYFGAVSIPTSLREVFRFYFLPLLPKTPTYLIPG